MTENALRQQEINEEAAILDKACRHCGGELATHGGNHLRQHAAAISALMRKLDRLEAAAASLVAPKTETPRPATEPWHRGDVTQPAANVPPPLPAGAMPDAHPGEWHPHPVHAGVPAI
jgi:hypothetical protein